MQLNWSTVKPSVLNFFIVGLTAVLFISLAKWASAKWPIPGVADVINSV